MTRAAFEVNKGMREVLSLSEADVMQCLDPAELLRELEASFGALARGEVQCPPRPELTIPGKGFSLAMSAWQPGRQICVKVVNVFDGNLTCGLPNHLAILNLFDAETICAGLFGLMTMHDSLRARFRSESCVTWMLVIGTLRSAQAG